MNQEVWVREASERSHESPGNWLAHGRVYLSHRGCKHHGLRSQVSPFMRKAGLIGTMEKQRARAPGGEGSAAQVQLTGGTRKCRQTRLALLVLEKQEINLDWDTKAPKFVNVGN